MANNNKQDNDEDDGSFGYTKEYLSYKSQSGIVVVRHIVDGKVNGGTILDESIWGSLCEVFENGVLPFDFEDHLAFINAVDYNGYSM